MEKQRLCQIKSIFPQHIVNVVLAQIKKYSFSFVVVNCVRVVNSICWYDQQITFFNNNAFCIDKVGCFSVAEEKEFHGRMKMVTDVWSVTGMFFYLEFRQGK